MTVLTAVCRNSLHSCTRTHVRVTKHKSVKLKFSPIFTDFCYKSFQEFLEIQSCLDFKYYVIGNEFGGDCAFGAIAPF